MPSLTSRTPTRRPVSTTDHGAAVSMRRRPTRVAVATLYGALIAAVMVPGPALAAPEDCAGDAMHIEVTVENLRNAIGLVAAILYDGNPRNFLAGGRSVSKTRVPAQENTATFCVDAPAPGQYALIVYHDENSNREFDFSPFTGPSEGTGFSNNPVLEDSLPDHAQVVFTVDEELERLLVFLNYP